jgi:hypothetical protein
MTNDDKHTFKNDNHLRMEFDEDTDLDANRSWLQPLDRMYHIS